MFISSSKAWLPRLIDLRRYAKLTKQRVEYVARKEFQVHRLWQKGYYDHILRSRHAVEAAVRYVLANPVRAGLAKHVGEYPFCGTHHP